MNARALTFDEGPLRLEADRTRTRRGMTLSVVLHAVLLLWIVLAPVTTRTRETLTEITLLGPGAPAAAGDPAPMAAAIASVTTTGAATAGTRNERFRREAQAASVEPTPQSDAAVMDRLNARLAAIRSDQPAPLASGPALGAPSSAWSAPATAAGPGGDGGSPIALHRGGGTGSSPLALSRGGGHSLVPATAVGGLPGAGEAGAPATPAGGDVTARRTLAGASLAGPIANREILHYTTPPYPEWAKRDGIEGVVTLYFVVRADGSIKENVLVQKTAGFSDFDDNARAALRGWRFEPLAAGRTGEQWGTITFHYRLRGA